MELENKILVEERLVLPENPSETTETGDKYCFSTERESMRTRSQPIFVTRVLML